MKHTLIRIKFRQWTPVVKVAKDKVETFADRFGSDPKAINVQKKLIDSSAYKHINEVKSQIRKTIASLCLPFPIETVFIAPEGHMGILQENLDILSSVYENEVDAFSKLYRELYEENTFQMMLGDLYDPRDYPHPDFIKDYFGFEYMFFDITPPHVAQSEAHAKKLEKLMEQAEALAVQAVRDEFIGLIDSLKGKLEGKRIHSSTLARLKEFIENFKARNIFNDEFLGKIIEEHGEILGNLTLEDLSKSVSSELHKAVEEIHNSFSSLPVRKLVLPEKDAA